jgi:D-alanyl-D-alanine carboxypeptidase
MKRGLLGGWIVRAPSLNALIALAAALLACACSTPNRAPPGSPPWLALGRRPAQPSPPLPVGRRCDAEPAFASAARYNAASSLDLPVSLFGRAEMGWRVYAPLAAETVGTTCAPDSEGFSAAVARWQGSHGLSPDGAVTSATLLTLKGVWQEQRPFVMMRLTGVCPAPPDEAVLWALAPTEAFYGKPVQLLPPAAAALRRMVTAARADLPTLARDPDLFAVFSGYRSPGSDAARCAAEHNCQGLVRAACSAHRTGLAADLDVGFAPGFTADSSDDANRLYQTQGLSYQWLVRNAGRFGFVNYAFEPWHWEWAGQTGAP